jgi:hypothetical protein
VSVFKDDKDNKYKLNQFRKTTDFGSSGAGERTKEIESIQSFYLAVGQILTDANGHYIPLSSHNLVSSFTKVKDEASILVHLQDGIRVDEDLILEFNEWAYTFFKIPNKLWSISEKRLDRSQIYTIYHNGYTGKDSPFIAIRSKYYALSKGKFKVNINKFCPADVYMVAAGRDGTDTTIRDVIIGEIKKANSIDELVLTMNRFFDAKKLIPLSMKKVTSDDLKRGNSKIQIITNNETNTPLIEFTLDTIGITKSPMLGISSRIIVTSIWKKIIKKVRTMVFRSGDTSNKQDIRVEVEGSASRHGNLNLKEVRVIIKESGINNLPVINSSEELVSFSSQELESMINSIHADIIEKAGNQRMEIKYLPRGFELDTNNKKISKLQSLQLIRCLLELNRRNRSISNRVITDIFKYALSIQTRYFITPKYLRVI